MGDALTPAELRVLMAAAGGSSTKSTATFVRCSVDTVKQHRSRAIKKLGASTMAHAVAIAIAHGVIECEPLGPAGGISIRSGPR